MSLSTRFLNNRDSDHPILRHERVLGEDLDTFENEAGTAFEDLAGEGRTDETVKGNADDIDDLEAAIGAWTGGYGVIDYEVTEGGVSIKIYDAEAPFKFEIVNVFIQCRNNSANGTIKLTDGTHDITDAIVCATAKAMTQAGTIDEAYSTILADGTLEIVCAGDTVANTQALVTIMVIPRAE